MNNSHIAFILVLSASLSVSGCLSAEPAPNFVALDGKPLTSGNEVDKDGYVRKVKAPVLHLIRTKADFAKGTILLCPGGGYGFLAIGHEGTSTAEFLNAQGFDVAILEYAVSAGEKTRDLALADALAAWRLVKSQAKNWVFLESCS